jgi:hypothetical protein
MPDCWLGVSFHSQGAATGQLDQVYPNAELVREFHVALHASRAALSMVALENLPYYTPHYVR